jgi:hypothetical protein
MVVQNVHTTVRNRWCCLARTKISDHRKTSMTICSSSEIRVRVIKELGVNTIPIKGSSMQKQLLSLARPMV